MADQGGYASSDSEKNEPEHTAILICGRSRTGKSTLIPFILRRFSQYNKPIYALNDKSKQKKYAKLDWSQIPALSDAALIVEDLIQVNTQQHRQLQYILSFKIHHARYKTHAHIYQERAKCSFRFFP